MKKLLLTCMTTVGIVLVCQCPLVFAGSLSAAKQNDSVGVYELNKDVSCTSSRIILADADDDSTGQAVINAMKGITNTVNCTSNCMSRQNACIMR